MIFRLLCGVSFRAIDPIQDYLDNNADSLASVQMEYVHAISMQVVTWNPL